jgi:hypothetical protein
MKNITRLIVIFLFCFMVAGCYETFPPIKSGNITHWQNGKPDGSAQQLTTKQIANISEWLQSHRWGWQSVMATYAPSITINVEHEDGTKSVANLMKNTLIVGKHQRTISDAEHQALMTMLSE